MPSAVPGSTATMGFPSFLVLKSMPASSILRRILWISITISKHPCAGFSGVMSFVSAITAKSIPAAKSDLAEVMITPLTSGSLRQPSISAFRSEKPWVLITFIGRVWQSQVMVARPSASSVWVKSDIYPASNLGILGSSNRDDPKRS